VTALMHERIRQDLETTAQADLTVEQTYLDTVIAAYEAAMDHLTRPLSVGGDAIAREALAAMRQERLRVYRGATGPLYFGRIDQADDKRLYVGRHLIADGESRHLVINWRAPAAAAFYTATPRNPLGVRCRRRLAIEDRQVLDVVDEWLDTDASDTLTAAIVVDILRRRTGAMRQIISTITADQYRLIEADRTHVQVVQGGPGTGKTAVGLHRAALLLYQHEELRRQGVLIVGPNAVFMRYIRDVLPALGETAVEQRTVAQVAAGETPEQDEPEVTALRADARMATVLERMLWSRVASGASLTLSTAGARYGATVSAPEMDDLIADARERGSGYRDAGSRFRTKLAQLLASRMLTRAGAAILLTSDELGAAIMRDPDFRHHVAQTWPAQKPETLVRALSTNPRRVQTAAEDLLSSDELGLLSRSRPPRPSLTAADPALLDEARWLIDQDARVYGHVVVDEAQNLTEMELRMLLRRASRHSMTVLGDIDQRTLAGEHTGWESLLRAAGAEDIRTETLTVSYRVPADFLRLAAAGLSARASAPRGARDADRAAISVLGNGEAVNVAVRVALHFSAEVGSTALIAPPSLMAATREALAHADFCDVAVSGIGDGLNLVDLEIAKGLEVDAVVVLEPAEVLATPRHGGRGGLYTAVTRSTQALALVHDRALPSFYSGHPDLQPRSADRFRSNVLRG
jgi:DNA helicase IV